MLGFSSVIGYGGRTTCLHHRKYRPSGHAGLSCIVHMVRDRRSSLGDFIEMLKRSHAVPEQRL